MKPSLQDQLPARTRTTQPDLSRHMDIQTVPAQRPAHGTPGGADIEPPTELDRLLHSIMARATGGVSPAALTLAYLDWALHLGESPGKWTRLAQKAWRKESRLLHYLQCAASGLPHDACIAPLAQDRRFTAPAWQKWPFNFLYQAFLLNQQWWHNATTGIGGVSAHHEQVVAFVARQLLDMVSPVNFIATNPEVLEATVREGGQNLLRGAANLVEDWERSVAGKPPVGSDAYLPGRDVAITPGRVVYRNRLIELIQYAPATAKVHPEPLLIVPAWIMKYYILDLSPHNSLARYLVERGHTVFMISWHNPEEKDRDLGMDDYLQLGVLDALDAVRRIVPGQRVNTVGYCIGGTLLSIAAAALAQDDHGPLNSVTLLAAQTDFTEAGELRLFIDESEIDHLEDMMWHQGYLDNRQMAGAFQLLRSRDLIWSQGVHHYLLGERAPMTDLMAWNADATRMPYRMQSEYLRGMFLNNDLFAGRYRVNGRPLALSDIETPIFAVATEADHVAPWRSVYKLNLVVQAEVTFVLTSGGHNAGIVSEPGHPRRTYRISHWQPGAKYIDPDSWFLGTPAREGSWWPAWAEWLLERSGTQVAPPAMGGPPEGEAQPVAAPGRYVLEH
jgi:polyhydroxyalkanoate synthase